GLIKTLGIKIKGIKVEPSMVTITMIGQGGETKIRELREIEMGLRMRKMVLICCQGPDKKL
ncbi:hypothetical protein HAX54_041715, partial [Datura stramonium]|nr:hypothetical protein [Datura stramonium]